MEPTCWACFRYGAQALKLSVLSSYTLSGMLAKDFELFLFPYLFVACIVPLGGFLMAGKGLVSSFFRLSLPFFLPLSTVTSHLLPLSSLASYFLLLSRT